jgi:FkbM family methyltransferase
LVFSKTFRGQEIYHTFDLEQILSFHIYEDGLRNKVWNIRPNDVVMDIGTDFGPYTLTALSQGAKHVYAVEPRYRAIEKLEENLQLNNNNDFSNRVTIIDKAVSNASSFIIMSDTSLSSSLIEEKEKNTRFNNNTNTRDNNNNNKQATFTTTIDEIVTQYKIKKLDWIKIDIEGYEFLAILGGLGTLETLGPNLLIENHSTNNEKKIHKILVQLGYNLIYSHQELLYFNHNITHNFYSIRNQ